MRLYFTARDNIGSKLIRWVTDGDVSHVAVGFGGSVYHSTEHGVLMVPFDSFMRAFKIKRTLQFSIPDTEGLLAFSAMIPKDAGYDYSAFAYFAWREYKRRFLGEPIPKKNLWNSKGYLCTEMVGFASDVSDLLGYGPLIDNQIDLSITSPIELYYLLETKSEKVIKCS